MLVRLARIGSCVGKAHAAQDTITEPSYKFILLLPGSAMFLLPQVQEQSSQLQHMRTEAALLEATLQDSQRQAMALGSRLTLAENKNDELLSQTQVC